MKRFSYGERDYAFGQRLLTLRSAIGLTQAALASYLGVSRKAVGAWEAGETYPKAAHLKALLTLCVRQQVFPPGREEEEIRAFWDAAHQKVLLEEVWLSSLLQQPSAPPQSVLVEESAGGDSGSAGQEFPCFWGTLAQCWRNIDLVRVDPIHRPTAITCMV